jgi:hypothetical protein
LRNEESTLIRITKEGTRKNPKLFLSITRPSDQGQEFIVIKRCEVPFNTLREENIEEDMLSCCFHLLDVGTDRIVGKIEINGDFTNPFNFEYSRIVLPFFEDFKIYLASLGDGGSFLKKICVELTDRPSQYLGEIERSRAHCLCTIF